MNEKDRYLKGARQLIYQHSPEVTFSSTTTGEYNIETGTVETTETSTTVRAFPKKVIATQYNAPSLIGQTLTEFLVLASDLTNKPKAQDKATLGTEVFTVQTVKEHCMYGAPMLYKVLCSAG